MSRGTKLQEMEVKRSNPRLLLMLMQNLQIQCQQWQIRWCKSYEDLGGPTPENSKPDDDSNKLKTPGTTLKQVKDIVN